MKFKSPLMSQASGSTAGLVASHNRGGLYFRARSIPTNPNTPQQQLVRANLSTLVDRWRNTLTAPQRAAWQTYAGNITLVDRLGEARVPTAQNCYVRCNTPRMQSGLAIQDAAPTTFNLGNLSNLVVVSSTATTQLISLGFNNSDPWAVAAGGALLIYTSQPQDPTINFFKGPYRYAGRINGASTPPTSPAAVTAAFTFAAGQRIFIRAVASAADGRLSAEWFGGGVGV